MHKPLSAARREFDPVEAYQYPEHLRPFIVDLPSSPGVYVFHSDSDVMPLYVGKSVNIRSWVMSHLRTAEEARMLRQARRLSFHRTAGEIGALLLEAQMIKQLQPLHNKRLRRNRQLCSIQVVQGVPSIVSAKEIDFARTPDLYGLYSSRRAAQQSLLAIGDSEQLCYSLLGLERVSRGRPCFRHHLGRCAGTCCGREYREEHHLRLMDALGQMRIFCWPFSGPVGLVETLAQAAGLRTVSPSFDSDGYKILCGPIMSGRHDIIELN